jgi:hypothetical protein
VRASAVDDRIFTRTVPMKVKTKVKAGKLAANHNTTVR